MGYEDELNKAIRNSEDLIDVLNEAQAAPEYQGDPEIGKLIKVTQGWIDVLLDNPSKEYIDDVLTDLRNEVQYFDWGGHTEFGEFSDRINELQNEFYEAMIYLVDSIKEAREESIKEQMADKLKKRV